MKDEKEKEPHKAEDTSKSTTEPQRYYSRPRDESLEAFKDWIKGVVKALNPNAKEDMTMTEEMWEADWREFWSKVKQEANK